MLKKIKDVGFHIIKERDFSPILIFSYFQLKIKKLFKIDFVDNDAVKMNIDVILLTTSKDFSTLQFVLNSLKYLNHKINKVYIVSKKDPFIDDFCNNNGVTFIEENSVLGYGKEKNIINISGVDRSGWIFQQLLKLAGDNIAQKENYFIIDSDTILINKTNLLEDNKFVFFQNEEWNKLYFEAFFRLFGYKNKNKLSFTSHMMIFNKEKLKDMKKELESKHSCKWDEAYVQAVDKTKMSSISDYDTYANWVLYNFPNEVKQKPLYNKSLSRNFLKEIDNVIKKYKDKYKSISFHSYVK